MKRFEDEFHERVSRIPFHGLGLSVDVYSPNLCELIEQLETHALPYGYLEIFKANHVALQNVRTKNPSIYLEYHADGLWVTQPDWKRSYRYEDELTIAMTHLRQLRCSWLNQECATKQIAGHSFGTYLPPLFTEPSAHTTAANAQSAQQFFDDQFEVYSRPSPLFLLETPPLTFFAISEMSYADFFSTIAETCACGFVLDIGHLWTVYRYTGVWQDYGVEEFLEGVMNSFPLERVVQVHIAGLGFHPVVPRQDSSCRCLPNWIDSHDSIIPDVLFKMLDQVLSHPRLVNVRAVGLEVDTKSIPCIIQEWTTLSEQCREWEQTQRQKLVHGVDHDRLEQPCFIADIPPRSPENSLLEVQYRDYVEILTQYTDESKLPISGFLETVDMTGVNTYRQDYLPHEIFEWGGDLREMFPATMQALKSVGGGCEGLLRFWYSHPHSFIEPYDFFLIKVHYFVEFIRAEYPECLTLAVQEATDLRNDYALACQPTPSQDYL